MRMWDKKLAPWLDQVKDDIGVLYGRDVYDVQVFTLFSKQAQSNADRVGFASSHGLTIVRMDVYKPLNAWTSHWAKFFLPSTYRRNRGEV